MSFFPSSKRTGTIAVLALLAGTTQSAHAEPIATINGTDIDSTVLDTYIEGRLQKPAAQMTADEREMVLQELTDIYLLTTQPRAKELAKQDTVKAQAELQYRGILAQAVASDYLSSNEASEEEILAEYESQRELSPPLQFKARHILVETQAAADGLITRLNDGADFEQLARDNSTGPSGPNGGDLGWFSPGQMVPQFSEAIADLEDGTFTKSAVQTQFGWHVILREESRANEPPTLESVRDVVKQRIEQQKFQRYLDSLRATQEPSD